MRADQKSIFLLVSSLALLHLPFKTLANPVEQYVTGVEQKFVHPQITEFQPISVEYAKQVVNFTEHEIASNKIAEIPNQQRVVSRDAGNSNETTVQITKGHRFKRARTHAAGWTLEDIYFRGYMKYSEQDGDPVPVTAWQRCDSGKCTITQTVSHTVTVTSSIGIPFALSASQVFGISIAGNTETRAVAEGQASAYNFELDSPGEGRIMFKPRLLRMKGLMTRNSRDYCAETGFLLGMTLGLFSLDGKSKLVDCFNDPEKSMFNVDLLAPIRSGKAHGNQVLGTFYLEYKADPTPVDADNFHIIRDKDIPGQIDLSDISSGSPKMCAHQAKDRGHNFAVWRAGRCYFKRTDDDVGRLTSKFAMPIGNYNLPIPNAKSSANSQDRDEWVRQGECDLIQEYASYGYYCKKFNSSRDTVMMFKKSEQYKGAAGQTSLSPAIFHPDK